MAQETDMPAVTQLFEAGLGGNVPPPQHQQQQQQQHPRPRPSAVDELILKTLQQAVLDVAASVDGGAPAGPEGPELEAGSPIVAGIGDYLFRTAQIWGVLADKLARGPHMKRALVDVHEQARREHHVSDMSALADMDVRLSRINKVRELCLDFSNEVQKTLRPEPSPKLEPQPTTSPISSDIKPFFASFTSTDSSQLPQPALASDDSGDARTEPPPRPRRVLPDKGQQRGQQSPRNPASPDDMSVSSGSSDDNELTFERIDMNALRQRGKGEYFCPLGRACDKGGVDKEGKLILFDRNSAFAQHCNKHRKPWRCDEPGCPNPPKKRRFARRDGLERHKITVKHNLLTSAP